MSETVMLREEKHYLRTAPCEASFHGGATKTVMLSEGKTIMAVT